MTFRLRNTSTSDQNQNHINNNDNNIINYKKGVIISPFSGVAVTSWGLRSIDNALSGGIPLSTLTLVSEDKPTSYHVPLTSYVTAQGIQHEHSIVIASFGMQPKQIINKLPAPVINTSSDDERIGGRNDMKIAWRYGSSNNGMNNRNNNEKVNTDYISDFDLSKEHAKISSNYPISSIPTCNTLDDLLNNINKHLIKASKIKLLTRIIIHHLSPSTSSSNINDIVNFLVRLRSLTRIHDAIAVVSCHSLPYSVMRTVSDACLVIDSFHGKGAGVAGLGSQWLGVLVVKKIYSIRGVCLSGRGDVWVFKRGRRKYSLERATAAPDDEVPDEQDEDDTGSNKTSVICGSRPNSKSNVEF